MKETIRIFPLRHHVTIIQPLPFFKRNRIFSDDIQSKIYQDVWNLMVDQRINMIWTSHQQNNRAAFLFRIFQNLRRHASYLTFELLLRFLSLVKRPNRNPMRHTETCKIIKTSLLQQLLIVKVDWRHVQWDFIFPFWINDISNHICITRNNGTVITIRRVAKPALFIEDHREEDSIHTQLDQVHNVPADQLCREAQVIRHDVSR